MNPSTDETEQPAHAIPAERVELCPLRSIMVSHYNPDGSCRCSDLNPTGEKKDLTMCETCTGSGKISRPGARHDLVKCPACHGEGVR